MDVVNEQTVRDICTKKPWYEYTPDGYMKHSIRKSQFIKDEVNAPEDAAYKNVKTQADFLREYYPTSHLIFDESVYPDVYKQDPETKRWYLQPIQRTAFAFQQLIATKHILHLTGNDVQFEIADSDDSLDKADQYAKELINFKRGWLLADMEQRFYEAVRGRMIVAESAIVGYFGEDGKFGAMTLSYLNGDILYAHNDSITGKLNLFARKYYDYDETGAAKVEHVEVWDDTYMYRFEKSITKEGKFVTFVKGIFGLSGYTLIYQGRHGFPFIPVAYNRDDRGPCWSPVQKNIEDYEEAFSYLCENNKAYAFPYLVLNGAGDDINVIGDPNGAAKTIAINDPDGKAGFINGTDASNAFATQLDKSYELIYELSFTVKPPELKSGDLPGVALKLLYSPAIEAAMNDAQMMQPFLSDLVQIVKFGIGHENDDELDMMKLPINAWIEPYVHQNNTELVTNLATAVQNNFLSHQTASERISMFAKNDEYDRIISEQKEKQEQDLLVQIREQDAQTQNNIEEQEAQARIDQGQSGSDINTGRGGKLGRPNKSGKEWDKNGNNPIDDANNWKDWNAKH